MTHEGLYLGIDVGGTKILALLVTEDGAILARHKQAVPQDPVPLADQIAGAVEGVLDKAGRPPEAVQGLGVGVPAVVDSRKGLVVHAPNLAVDDPRLVKRLKQRFPWPVALGNDVNLGTLAETWIGAGQGVSDLVGIFVGTGIGGGVVLGGELRTGPEDQAGEIGHLVLQVDGPVCGCGNCGCFEALASRTAIERNLREALEAGRKSSITSKAAAGRLTSGTLASALEAGDELVTEVMRREAHYLAQGIISLRHVLNPELIVLGGGVMEACGEWLLPLIQTEVDADCLRRSRAVMRLTLSQLADDAVALGAAALLRRELLGSAAESPQSSNHPRPTPTVDRVEFGLVVVNGEEYPHDLYLRANGKIVKRKKKHAREKHGTSHVLDAKELERVCKGSPTELIIGNGFDSALRLAEDGQDYLETRGLTYRLLSTPEAAAAYNADPHGKALFLHVTC
ncbi:MAG: ROK family protein [candidate division WS1 bacterium]|jgi:glucokinase|nr:ROK family protein [candidate division WS1 bacterium]